jgi:hypothetical protein
LDDVSHLYILGGIFARLILQNDLWLSHIAISPKNLGFDAFLGPRFRQ